MVIHTAWANFSLDSKRNAAQILDSYDWLSSQEGASAVVDATGAEVCTQTAILVTRKNGIFLQAGMAIILGTSALADS